MAFLMVQGSAAWGAEAGSHQGPAAALPSHVVTRDPAAVRRYWTPQRMRQAQPLDFARRAAAPSGSAAEAERAPRIEPNPLTHAGVNRFEITDTTSYPARVHGRVFLTFPGEGDFACSGTAIGSPAGNVAVSAGHCVFDAGFSNTWATNWTFIPGYHDGQSPFGEWVAQTVASTPGWVAEDFRYDVGMAVMQPLGGSQLEQAVGARGIAFNQAREQQFRAFGYPAEQPPFEFTGERLFACDSAYGGEDSSEPPPSPMLISCDMTAGSSGGGWVIHDTFVNSVISYGYMFQPNDMYGPYFDSVAEALYREVSGIGACLGREPTLVGTNASETLVGTSGADVIVGLGGDDQIESGAGDDVICAGAGNDTMAAGAGNDGFEGGDGTDSASFSQAASVEADLARGKATGEGKDNLASVEQLTGSPGKDVLTGDKRSNSLLGEAGRDLLIGGRGDDMLAGGKGKDTASFAKGHGVTASTRKAKGQGRDRLKQIENLTGSGRADVLTGDNKPNRLRGGGGPDKLRGRGGHDLLRGGGGVDSCNGGAAQDGAKTCETARRL